MKLPYIKPGYSQILLDANSGTGSCTYTVNHEWFFCPIDLFPDTMEGLYTVFSDAPCTITDFDENSFCYQNGGHNNNVYGS